MPTSQIIYLSGMTCPACEKLVKKRLEKISGVISVTADHVRGQINLTVSRQIPVGDIKIALRHTQYTLLPES
jgi:copper chaperone CopZ